MPPQAPKVGPLLRGPALCAAALCIPILGLLAPLCAQAAAPAPERSVTIHNGAAEPVVLAQIRPSGAPGWGANLLRGSIPPGGAVTFHLQPQNGPCLVDVRLEQASGRLAVAKLQDSCDPDANGTADVDEASGRPESTPAAKPPPATPPLPGP